MPPTSKTVEEIELEKNLILEQALKIISSTGSDTLTMRALAKECNSSSTKIYYYFKNKEHILFQLEEIGFLKLKNRMHDAISKQESAEDKFTSMLTAIYEFGVDNPDFFNLMFGTNSPKFLDYFDDSKLKDFAASEKSMALDFFKLLVRTTYAYGLTVNRKITDLDVIVIFTQIVGILQLYVANIYQEIDINPKNVFDLAVNSILINFHYQD